MLPEQCQLTTLEKQRQKHEACDQYAQSDQPDRPEDRRRNTHEQEGATPEGCEQEKGRIKRERQRTATKKPQTWSTDSA
jgi:hypothetical protein